MKDDLHLRQFAFYIRREQGLAGASWGLVAGLGIAVALNAAAWLFPILSARSRVVLSVLLPAGAMLAVFLVVYLYPRPPTSIARRSDARMRLGERLATALEIQDGNLPVPHEIARRQRDDARAAAARADPSRAFRPIFPARQAWMAAILLAVLITGFLLPNPQDARLARQQAEREAIEKQVERLEKVRSEIAAAESLDPAEREALLQELDEAIRELRDNSLSGEEALARLAETEGRLQELRDETIDEDTAALWEAGRQAAQGEQTREMGRALVEGNYAAAAEAAAALGEQLPQLTPEQLAAVAERLEAMADVLGETAPELSQALQDAAAAMRQGDLDAARQALRRAAEQTEQAGQQIATQDAIEGALGQIQEGRRELAQSSQQRQGQQGQGQQGQGQQGQGQQGQGQQGQGQQGQGSSGSGSGDADGAGGSGTPQPPDGPIPPNAPGQAGETQYDPIYAPEQLGEGEGEQVHIVGQGEGGPTSGESGGAPPLDEEALVPYDEVYTDYQAQAASALENSYIPRSVKEYVRAYFSSLDPDR
jgi:hypothetical protein